MAVFKKILFVFIIFAYVCLSGLSAVFIDLYMYAEEPASTDQMKKNVLVIPGQGFSVTTKNLLRAGVM